MVTAPPARLPVRVSWLSGVRPPVSSICDPGMTQVEEASARRVPVTRPPGAPASSPVSVGSRLASALVELMRQAPVMARIFSAVDLAPQPVSRVRARVLAARADRDGRGTKGKGTPGNELLDS